MALSADDITRAFGELSAELTRNSQQAELLVAGGAALVLLFRARESTKDVDAYFIKPAASLVREAARTVAERLLLPTDWLNDAAKGYFVGVSVGETLYESDALVVRAASAPQLLAMKLSAWRDAIDRADAALLLRHLTGDREAIWLALEPYLAAHQRDKAGYAFDDLWDSIYGHS